MSDLHLQETRHDGVRFRRDGRLYEAGVARNVTPSAFARFFDEIRERAEERASREVHLVLAGDILELHRTPLWFMGAHRQARPTQTPGEDIQGNPLRAKIHEILDHLEAEHAAVWSVLRDFVAGAAGGPWPVRVHYLPGNHDRLANAWPSVRQRVRRLLAMDGNDPSPFPVVLDFTEGGLADYRVRVRHGQEYDPPNFAPSTDKRTALDRSWEEYLAPAFGDFITIDVAARLALAFRALYAVELRRTAGTPREMERAEHLRRLYLDLTEFDDVRPASLLADYLVTRMGVDRRETFGLLRPVMRDVVENAVADPFFRQQASRFISPMLLNVLPALMKNLKPKAIEDAVRLVIGKTGEESGGTGPAQRVREELRWTPRGPFDLVVSGHTHYPEQVPLPSGLDEQPVFYLNSGTWRTTIPAGVDCYGRLRAYTMVYCFNREERERTGDDGRHFETWTGHRAAGTIGPYEHEVQAPVDEPPVTLQLRFTALEVRSVEREVGGAELRVRFGVDGESRAAEWKKVRPGARLEIDQPPVPLDPGLDGELWFVGEEVDLGPAGLDPHDLLPWALDRLPRDPQSRQFISGDVVLPIQGRGETDFLLHATIGSGP